MALDRAQLKALRQRLRERELAARAELRNDASHRAEAPYADLAGDVHDEGEAAAADVTVDIDNALIDLQLRELGEINAARERIRRHAYGKCADCGQDIGFERLMACPTAQRCVPCQNIHDKTFASARSSML